MMFPVLVHLFFDCAACGGVCKTAKGRFTKFHRQTAAHFAHGIDHFVGGDLTFHTGHSHISSGDGVHRTDHIALNTGYLHQAGNGIADQAQQIFQGDGNRVADLAVAAAMEIGQRARCHGAGRSGEPGRCG